jgi:phage baseplate assembly protein W
MIYIDIPDRVKKRDGTLEENSTYFKAVSNSLRNIIMTPKGSVPGNPEFGINISRVIFNQLDPLTSFIIEEEIRAAIDKWEPRVEIKNIIVDEVPEYNRITCNIIFKISNDLNDQDHSTKISIQR